MVVVDSDLKRIEAMIRENLQARGIKCQSIYEMPDPDERRILLAFNSQKNPRLSVSKVERVLNEMGAGSFIVPREFQRLSSAFLHLEVVLGARTEAETRPTAT
jgi:hypothetical protein